MAITGPYEKIVRYFGLSTDTKPTENIKVGTRFFETDTGDKYIYTGSAWVVIEE